MMSRRCFSVSTLLAGLLTCAAGFALDGPKQRPVLTVSGKIGEKNAGETARFDMKMIEARRIDDQPILARKRGRLGWPQRRQHRLLEHVSVNQVNSKMWRTYQPKRELGRRIGGTGRGWRFRATSRA